MRAKVNISDKSGLAELLREQLGRDADAMVVETDEKLEKAAREWERRIETVLMERAAAFARAAEIRGKLASKLTWQDAVQKLENSWAPVIASPPREST